MDKEIVVRLHASFEDMVRKHPDTGTEFWCARDLQMLLGYLQWRSFAAVIDKAITACQNAGYEPRDHFAHVSKMVDLGSGAKREIEDTQPRPRIMFFRLTRRLQCSNSYCKCRLIYCKRPAYAEQTSRI